MMEMKVCVEKTGGLMVLADTFSQVRSQGGEVGWQGLREGGREGGKMGGCAGS